MLDPGTAHSGEVYGLALALQHADRNVTTSVVPHDREGDSTAPAVLEQVDRFARRSVDAHSRRPEAPMDPAQMAALLDEARALGVVPGGASEGLGVWDSTAGCCGDASLSARMLRRLARSNAGFALATHRASLASWIVRRLGLTPGGHGTASVQGRFGLGRLSLARCLAGAPLGDDDRAALADCYGPDEERLLTSHDGFDWLVAPVADPRGTLAWAVWPREKVGIRRLPNAHGMDELATFGFRPPRGGAGDVGAGDAATGAECLAAALCMESVALMAIGLGAAEHGHAMARAYASARRQGGRPIEGHPAVQLLLASSRTATTTVEALVDTAARRPMAAAGLAGVLAARAEAHPLLCRAANDDLQVFGGSGYMRDTGAEKIVRDLNHLRVISGSPPELSLFVAELERIHG